MDKEIKSKPTQLKPTPKETIKYCKKFSSNYREIRFKKKFFSRIILKIKP